MEPISDIGKVAKNLEIDRSWALGKTYCYYSAK